MSRTAGVAPAVEKTNGKKHATQQSVDAAIWSICDIMRRSNCAGALQYVPELTWILFLRILDERTDGENVAVTIECAEHSLATLGREGIDFRVVDLNLDEIFEAYVAGKRTDDAATAKPQAELQPLI